MRKIYLYGDLGEKYGREHSFDVSSIREAMRALNCAYEGFFNDIKRDGLYEVYNGNEINEESQIKLSELDLINDTGDYHIIPVIAGSKSASARGLTFAVIGIALIATGWGGTLLGSEALASMSVSMGVGLAVAGVSTMLSPTLEPAVGVPEKKSFVFTSADNISTQGGPVPVIYGKHEVGSVIISTSLEAINA